MSKYALRAAHPLHAMADLIKLARGRLRLGQPSPFSIYDQHGTLLLKAGFRVNRQPTLDALQTHGWHYEHGDPVPTGARHAPPGSGTSVEQVGTFELVDLLKIRLQRAIDHFRNQRAEDFLKRIEGIALAVQEACTHDTDSALANLHLDDSTPYVVLHPLQAAILCEIVGQRLAVGDEARLMLVQAALTHDLALVDIQDELDQQYAPLVPEQRQRVHAHPEDSAALLRQLGVRDPRWLAAVRQHHERLDGSGYPAGVSGEALGTPARLLAIADTYSAMVHPRPYRKAAVSTAAMRELLMEQGGKTDRRLTELMIKELGVFPPGALVSLASGEIGMVKERQANSAHPVVYAFIAPDGMPLAVPLRRDTGRPEYRVQGLVPFANYKASVGLLRRLWNQE